MTSYAKLLDIFCYILFTFLIRKSGEMSLERTVKWIDKTGKISPYEILEGRDKFCKAIQYACRFLKFHYEQKGDKNTSKKLDALFGIDSNNL